jgi:hypothetical protein
MERGKVVILARKEEGKIVVIGGEVYPPSWLKTNL